MTVRFEAAAVAVQREEAFNVEYVVVAQNADGSGHTLEIQRALEFDEQDAGLGMDTYCLVHDVSATHYGGVTAWHVRDRKLTLELDNTAAEQLGAARFVITVPEDAQDTIVHALQRLLV